MDESVQENGEGSIWQEEAMYEDLKGLERVTVFKQIKGVYLSGLW